jgi:hypothetical protein
LCVTGVLRFVGLEVSLVFSGSGIVCAIGFRFIGRTVLFAFAPFISLEVLLVLSAGASSASLLSFLG